MRDDKKKWQHFRGPSWGRISTLFGRVSPSKQCLKTPARDPYYVVRGGIFLRGEDDMWRCRSIDYSTTSSSSAVVDIDEQSSSSSIGDIIGSSAPCNKQTALLSIMQLGCTNRRAHLISTQVSLSSNCHRFHIDCSTSNMARHGGPQAPPTTTKYAPPSPVYRARGKCTHRCRSVAALVPRCHSPLHALLAHLRCGGFVDGAISVASWIDRYRGL